MALMLPTTKSNGPATRGIAGAPVVLPPAGTGSISMSPAEPTHNTFAADRVERDECAQVVVGLRVCDSDPNAARLCRADRRFDQRGTGAHDIQRQLNGRRVEMCCDACVAYRREEIAAKVRAIDRRAVHQQYAVDARATVLWIGRRDDCEGGRQSFEQSAQFRADVPAQRRIHFFKDSPYRAPAQFGGEIAHARVRFVARR